VRTAHKEPVLSADGQWLHRSFGGVVIDREIAVFTVAIQGFPLVEEVRRPFADQALREELFGIKPWFEIAQEWSGVFGAQFLARRDVGVLRGAVDFVQSADDNQDVMRPGCVLFPNLVPVGACMSPASDFDNRAVGLQIDPVVSDIRISASREPLQFFWKSCGLPHPRDSVDSRGNKISSSRWSPSHKSCATTFNFQSSI
jgi:hypothetical protein